MRRGAIDTVDPRESAVNEGGCPEWESNPHARYGQGILSPLCLPFHHPGTHRARPGCATVSGRAHDLLFIPCW